MTNSSNQKKWYFITIISSFIILILCYIYNIYYITTIKKKLPSKHYSKKNVSVRGSIISKDGFVVSKSTQIYKAVIDTKYLDTNKKELFINLFSIYSNISKKYIEEKLNSKKVPGKLVLSYDIDSRAAANLRQLSKKLLRLNVFIPRNKHNSFVIGLDILISGDKRIYPYKKLLTPLIGHIKKYELSNITRVKGINGLEKYYNTQLNNFTDGLLKGQRDVIGDIIFNKASSIITTKDGTSIKLNIPLKLQTRIEFIADFYKKKFQAKEILISIMNSQTGEILSLATSNRYYPKKILKNEISYLDISAISYQFEPGSIVKPITMALVIDNKKLKLDELIYAHNKGNKNSNGKYRRGKYKINKHTIGDDHQFDKHYISPFDIIVYSSNIGILKLAQRLSAKEFLNGFHKFGLGKKSNIDLPYERVGKLHSLKQYQAYQKVHKDNIFKATDSYGQGITATFMQMLKAYSTFNNQGKILTPQITSNFLKNNNLKKIKPKYNQKQIVSKRTAFIVKQMLIKTVQNGTGRGTNIEGLEIGGKTGTSQIAQHGKYQKKYISSFFGFANDLSSKYTIGVTVFEPSIKYHYASSSAVKVFKETIITLEEEGFLVKY